MQICITQRDGTRYFSRFRNIPERDRLEIELTIDDERPRVFTFDLTEALFEHFSKHPEILGKRATREEVQAPPKKARAARPEQAKKKPDRRKIAN